MSYKIVVLSDLHLSGKDIIRETDGKPTWRLIEDSYTVASQAIESAILLNPDAIIYLGDLFEAKNRGIESAKECFQFLNSFKYKCPWYVLPGNHDARYRCTKDAYTKKDFVKIFSKRFLESEPHWDFVIQNEKVHVIGVDSSKDFHEKGWLDEKQILYLKNKLNESTGLRKIVFMHHPAVEFNENVTSKEKLNAFKMEENHKSEIKNILNKHKGSMVISGHTHTRGYKIENGIHYVSCPSVNSWPLQILEINFHASSILLNYHDIGSEPLRKKSKEILTKSVWVEILNSRNDVNDYFETGQKSFEIKW